MKALVKTEQEVELKYLDMSVAVRYDDEDIPYDFPFRNGDLWEPCIDLDTHSIVGWPKGIKAHVHMKVCDEGSYYLLDDNGGQLLCIENGYVPNKLVPGEFGDYIIMDIDEHGVITNWPSHPSIEEFLQN